MALKAKNSKAAPAEEMKWPFGKCNYMLFGISLVIMIIGYIMLASGSDIWAPIFLTIGYCVLVPAAILRKDKKVVEDEVETVEEN